MRILYLSISYVPSRRASSVHVMKMCAALARQGHEVTLVTKRCPPRQEPGVEDDFAFYGVAPGFALRKLPRPAAPGGGVLHTLALARLLAAKRREIDLVYGRDPVGTRLAAALGLPVVFEAHAPPAGALSRRLHRGIFGARGFRRLVVISAALAERFAALPACPPPERLRVAHDAADPLADGAAPAPPPAAFGDRPAPHLGYVGHLYPGRGTEVLVELARRLPEATLHAVGGAPADLARLRGAAAPPNFVLHGYVPPARLPAYYRAFDLLLMPYERRVETALGRTDTSAWMSPLKMFEYMAAGRPIVSSDLPVLREVLEDGRNALLAPPGDAGAWEAAVRRLLADADLGRRLAAAALADFERGHTWDARAREVLLGL